MPGDAERAFYQALVAMKYKDYRAAAEHFDRCADYYKGDGEFNLLRQANRLLIKVKDELTGMKRRSEKQTAIEETR